MNKKITFSSSFSEQNDNEIKETLLSTPQQRIIEVVNLIRKIYSKELSEKKLDKKINFIIKN